MSGSWIAVAGFLGWLILGWVGGALAWLRCLYNVGGTAGCSPWVLYSAAYSRWLACIGLSDARMLEFYVSLSSYTLVARDACIRRTLSPGPHHMQPDGEVYHTQECIIILGAYIPTPGWTGKFFVSLPIWFVFGAVSLLFTASRDRPGYARREHCPDPLVIPEIHDFTRQPHTSTAINPAPLGIIHAFLTIVRQVAHPPATDTWLSEPPHTHHPPPITAHRPSTARPRHTPARTSI